MNGADVRRLPRVESQLSGDLGDESHVSAQKCDCIGDPPAHTGRLVLPDNLARPRRLVSPGAIWDRDLSGRRRGLPPQASKRPGLSSGKGLVLPGWSSHNREPPPGPGRRLDSFLPSGIMRAEFGRAANKDPPGETSK